MCIATLRRSCGRAERFYPTSLVQSTSFGCDALILIRFLLRACCADPLLQRLQQQRDGSFESDREISWDTTRQTEDDIHLIVCGVSLYVGSLASDVRHERSDGTEHSKNAAIIRGCIDFVMTTVHVTSALQPVDLTVASLEETTQVVALLRALSRHRQTWTFAMPAQSDRALESARFFFEISVS